MDYATFDGQVVILDDADWMISLLDKHGDVVVVDPDVSVPVKTSYGEFVFTSGLYSKIIDGEIKFVVPKFNDTTHGWYLLANPNSSVSGKDIVLRKKNDKSFFDKKTSSVQFEVEFEEDECGTKSRQIEFDEEVVELESDLTQPCENEFYSHLEAWAQSGKQVCFKTKFALGQKDEDTWKFHMGNISIVYPDVHKVTLVELTRENCMNYVNSNFKFNEFARDNSTDVCLVASSECAPDKNEFSQFLRELQNRDPKEYEKIIDEKMYLR